MIARFYSSCAARKGIRLSRPFGATACGDDKLCALRAPGSNLGALVIFGAVVCSLYAKLSIKLGTYCVINAKARRAEQRSMFRRCHQRHVTWRVTPAPNPPYEVASPTCTASQTVGPSASVQVTRWRLWAGRKT